MHTFFINTSKKDLDAYSILFDIHFENKKLLTMKCPMSDWNDEIRGYKSCVRQMGEIIDSYVEINNEFNLIIYIDLHDNEEYSAIPKGAKKEKERQANAFAMRILYTHVVYETIVDELDKVGRKPDSVLIMFGTEDKDTVSGSNEVTPSDSKKEKLIFKLLGIPTADVIEKIAIEVDRAYESDEDKKAAFEERFYSACTDELMPGLCKSPEYRDKVHLMCNNIMDSQDTETALGDFYKEVTAINDIETGRGGINSVSCPYDRYSSERNKSVSTLSDLNIALYLLRCVEADSIFETAEKGEAKVVFPFRYYTVDEIAPILSAKKEVFSRKAEEAESTEKLYSELRLTQRLLSFNYNEFGLNEYGERTVDTDDAFLARIPDDEYKTFEEKTEDRLENGEKKEGKKKESSDLNAIMEKYNRMADSLRLHHIDYLKELKHHVTQIMSNYAGKSREHKPAMLRLGRQSYIGEFENVYDAEKRTIGTVKEVADESYDTMVNQYFDFCSGGSVAITDIDEQCDWFKMRVGQITESLKKLKLIALGFLIAIIALYLPFVIIQFEAIFKNALTFTTAAASVAIPIMLLYLIFTAVSARQKRKYSEAWDKFKEKSDEALKSNRANVDRYDKLLQTIIPELRWVYEYKLDVDYYAETCDIADAKLEHHKQKLLGRVTSLENILSDLEYHDEENSEYYSNMSTEIEYGSPFCVGKKNRSLYSIIDMNSLKVLEKKGAQ